MQIGTSGPRGNSIKWIYFGGQEVKDQVHGRPKLRPVYSDTTQLDVELSCVGEVSIATPMQLNSTSSCRHIHSVNNCHRSVLNVVTQRGCL